MDEHNNDNVVYHDYGQGVNAQPPMPQYQNQLDYNVNPDGYAGYPDYIKNRGEDSKYGSVPRFDAMPYDQFQQPYPNYNPAYGQGYGYPYEYGANQYAQQNAPYSQPPYPQGGYVGQDGANGPYQEYGQQQYPQDSYGGYATGQPGQQLPYDPYQQQYGNDNVPRVQEQPYLQGYDYAQQQQAMQGYPEPERQQNVIDDIVGGHSSPQFDAGYGQPDTGYRDYAQQYNQPPQPSYGAPQGTGQLQFPVQQQSDNYGQFQMPPQMTEQFQTPQQATGQFQTPQQAPPSYNSGQFVVPRVGQPQQNAIRPPSMPEAPIAHYTAEIPMQPHLKPQQESRFEQTQAESSATFDTAVFSIKDIQPVTQQFDILPPTEHDVPAKGHKSAAHPQHQTVSSNDPFAASKPADDPFSSFGTQAGPQSDPFAVSTPAADLFSSFGAQSGQQSDPFGASKPADDPFSSFGTQGGQLPDPFGAPKPADDPFSSFGAQSGQQSDPFGASKPADDPFSSFGAQSGQQSDPFGASKPVDDPFSSFGAQSGQQSDPFAAPTPAGDPFSSFGAQSGQQSDPFAAPKPADDPFSSFGAQSGQQSDPFGVSAPADDPFSSFGAQSGQLADPFEAAIADPFASAAASEPNQAAASQTDSALGTFGQTFSAQKKQNLEITQEIELQPKSAPTGNPFAASFTDSANQDNPFAASFAAAIDASFAADGSAGGVTVKEDKNQETQENLLDRDYAGNIFESNFKLDDKPKPKPKEKLRDTDIFRIAEELSQAVLVKSHSRAFNDNNLMKEGDKRLVTIDRISSEYHISEGGGKPYRMYANVSLKLYAGTCCALVSDVPLAAYALTRSICESADQDYDDEPVRVADTVDGEEGQIMYVGSDSMLPEEMTCEEFLLYTKTGNEDEEDTTEKERLSVLLSQLGMSDMQQTDLRDLSYNKRILLIALAATLNPKIVCVVINDPKFRVDAEEEMLARRVFALLNNRGKCSLIACSSAYLMAAVTNRVAVLRRGELVFFGEYKKFVEDNCLGIMSFNVDHPETISQQLEAKYPGVSVLCKENLVYIVKKKGAQDVDLESLIKDIIGLGADYNSIVMDEKSFVMACKEVLEKG